MNIVQEYMIIKYSADFRNINTGEVRPLWHWMVAYNRDEFLEMCTSTLVKVI